MSAVTAPCITAPCITAPCITVALLATLMLSAGVAADAVAFTYKPHGQLIGSSGTGVNSTKDYVPGMRFPIEKAPAYANSQVYMTGGSNGPSGSQCAATNYAYPWWDNFCEKRTWTMPLCPSGKGHQGQDIRPGSCKFNTHWVVATEDGTITSIGSYAVYEKAVSGVTHRYLHMKMTALLVKNGQKVKKGQRLGLVDNDFGGTSTTLHLHYDRKGYVSGVGTVYLPTYASLVNSYQKLIGPTCDAAACSKKSSCGAWSACGGFTSTCDTTGSRKRTCTTYACSGATCGSASKTEAGACTVATDGKQVTAWGPWGVCAATGAGCDGIGKKTRSRTVCSGGASKTVSESTACTVSTTGKAMSAWTAWTQCTSGGGVCAESGTHSRSRSECAGGKATTVTQQGGCVINTSGQVVSAWGPWSPCGGFDSVCDETGSRQRVRQVCKAGSATTEAEFAACTVTREGEGVTPWSAWSGCVADVAPCAPTGSSTRSRQVCSNGAPVEQQEQQGCVPSCALGDGGGIEDVNSSGVDGTADPVRDSAAATGAEVPVQSLMSAAPSGGCSSSPARSDSRGRLPLRWFWLVAVATWLLMRRRRASPRARGS